MSLEALIKAALAEDLADRGDITTLATIPYDAQAVAVLRARKEGVVAGVDVAAAAFYMVDQSLALGKNLLNGYKVSKDDIILSVSGSASSILTAERTALNFLTHLSGTATLTRRYVDAVSGTKAKIYDTRKTLPGLRELQKAAVVAGGGHNHRMGLYDAILIKDNHIAVAGGIATALDKVSDGNKVSIEIEVDTLEQLEEVLKHGGADIVLLDNMDVPTLKKAVAMVDGRMITEASGGVNLDTLRAIAETGVDRIAVGALTHSAPALDIGLDIEFNP